MSHRARVLVIEDDPLFRSVMSSLLRGDYIVQVSGDGSEGFFRALEEPPDLALIDLRMPNWDGMKTLKAFRAHPSLADVKIVMLSAHATSRTIEAAMQAGADDFIIKTRFGPEEFLQKLARLLPEATGESPASGHAENEPRPGSENGFAGLAAHGNLNGKRPAGTDQARLQAILDDWE